MSFRYQPSQDPPEGQQSDHRQHDGQQGVMPPGPHSGLPYGQGPQPPTPFGPPPLGPPPGGLPPLGPPPGGLPPLGPPPYGPPPGGYPPHGGHQPNARRSSGLAISALVLGSIALLLCWVPIVNNFAAVLAVVGLGLGIPALISARRGRATGSGLAVAGVTLSVLAFIGVLATQALYSAVIEDVTDGVDDAVSLPRSEPTGGAGSAPGSETDAPAAGAAVLPLGQPGRLTEYTVTVDRVVPNGNDIVAAENQFNEPPAGQYVLVGLTVTYEGADEGDPWLDLSPEFIGTDARKYDVTSCSAVIPDAASDLPTLLTGGTASYQVCMDVPPTAIEGGRVEVSESLSFDDVSAVWAIR